VSPYTALLHQRPTTYLVKEVAQTMLIDAIRIF
jgi:hypothetical protein